ncbi:hypothetical protein EDD21DRAFT_434754 [Dissophora ornata]|nr:hypothetical protein EDD21DRAFT_434754 [Dissophora ornata]
MATTNFILAGPVNKWTIYPALNVNKFFKDTEFGDWNIETFLAGTNTSKQLWISDLLAIESNFWTPESISPVEDDSTQEQVDVYQSWEELAKNPHEGATYRTFYVHSGDSYTGNESVLSLRKRLKKDFLDIGEVGFALHNFKFIEDQAHLDETVSASYLLMGSRVSTGQDERDTKVFRHVWKVFDEAPAVWRSINDHDPEGWYLHSIYYPLFKIIASCSSQLQFIMSEKGLQPKLDLTHDAILRHSGLKQDLFVLEIKKPDNGDSDRVKIISALSETIGMEARRCPRLERSKLRAWGAIGDGFHMTFLEAQLVNGVVQVYHIGDATYPQEASCCHQLAGALSSVLVIKRRIESLIRKIDLASKPEGRKV